MAKTVMSCGNTYKNRYVPGKDEKYYTRDETNKLIELLQKILFQICADTSTYFEIRKDFRTTVCHILKEQYGGFIDGWELVTEEHTFLQLVDLINKIFDKNLQLGHLKVVGGHYLHEFETRWEKVLHNNVIERSINSVEGCKNQEDDNYFDMILNNTLDNTLDNVIDKSIEESEYEKENHTTCMECGNQIDRSFYLDHPYCSIKCFQAQSTDYINRCIECGIDMGPNNPRQLCGKTYCREMVPGYPEDQDYINIGEADYLLGNLTEEQMTTPPGSICACVSSSYASVACKRIVSFLTDPLQRIVTVGYSSGGAREHMLFRSECGEKLCIIYKTTDRGMRIYYLTREIIDGMVDGNPIAINWNDVEGLKE
jgi:hypothetical protein